LRYDPQHKHAVAVNPGQMELASHAMQHTLQINFHSVLDQPDRCDSFDGPNEDPVLVLSESRCGDMDTHHDMSSRISRRLHRLEEKASPVSMDAGSPLAVLQHHLCRPQYLCGALS
jgi:hypothetical protein